MLAALAFWVFLHTVITHSAVNTMLDASVGRALETWGTTSAIRDGGPGTDIYVSYGPLPGTSSAYPAIIDGVIHSCRIEIDPQWQYLDSLGMEDSMRDLVLLHEVGHCLGFAHPGVQPSVMENVMDGFSDYDAREVADLYPRMGYHLLVPAVSRN
jgi:hypothetical protein